MSTLCTAFLRGHGTRLSECVDIIILTCNVQTTEHFFLHNSRAQLIVNNAHDRVKDVVLYETDSDDIVIFSVVNTDGAAEIIDLY